MAVEDTLTQLAIEMIRYASQHSFKGRSQKADLLGFCELNRKYSRFEKKLQPSPVWQQKTDNYDMARNKITTYITRRVNAYPDNNDLLAEALLLVTEPYTAQIAEKIALKKAL